MTQSLLLKRKTTGQVQAAKGDVTGCSQDDVSRKAAIRLQAAARAKLGVCLRRLGRLDDAETQLREAVRLEPKVVAPRRQLAAALSLAAGREEEAADVMAAAVELRPLDSSLLREHAGLLLAADRATLAEKKLRRALELEPHDASLHAALGDALLKCNDPHTALASYEKSRKLVEDEEAAAAADAALRGAESEVSLVPLGLLDADGTPRTSAASTRCR